MDSSIEVPDSSDWLNTPVAPLHAVEAGLRCQVCKDFFDSPMITSCSHTFCSLCIRRCLVHDGKCPTCRAADQELRLRKNGTVAELVEAFQAARPSVIQLGKDVVEIRKTGTYGGHKRKLGGVARDDTEEPNPQRQKTRSQSRRSSRQQAAGIAYVGGGIYEGTDDGKHEPDDSMTACPICNRRMKEEDVFLHLDTHQDENEAKHPLPAKSSSNSLKGVSAFLKPNKPRDPLPQVNYPILKDTALRKKLGELGIPNSGSKALLIRRHTEWVSLWNASCDSSKPRTKAELLRELEHWEKTQGGCASNTSGILNGGSSVMKKDFDGAAWAAAHDDDFQRLIARARRKPDTLNKNSSRILDPGIGQDDSSRIESSVQTRESRQINAATSITAGGSNSSPLLIDLES